MAKIPKFKLKHQKDFTPILKSSDIESLTESVLEEYAKNSDYSLENPQATPIEDIVENYFDIPVEYCTFANSSTLGMTTFSDGNVAVIDDEKPSIIHVANGTILISSELSDDASQEGRFRYTERHELFHRIFHWEKFTVNDENTLEFDFGDKKPIECKAIVCHRDSIEYACGMPAERDWPEWQADYGSSCFLMPKKSVYEFWKPYLNAEAKFELSSTGKALLENMDYFARLRKMEEFKETYNVSKIAARIRLEKLRFINKGCWQ